MWRTILKARVKGMFVSIFAGRVLLRPFGKNVITHLTYALDALLVRRPSIAAGILSDFNAFLAALHTSNRTCRPTCKPCAATAALFSSLEGPLIRNPWI